MSTTHKQSNIPKGIFQPTEPEAIKFKLSVEKARGRQHHAPNIITHKGIKFFKSDGFFSLGGPATKNAKWLLSDGATTVFIVQLKSRLRGQKTPTIVSYFSPQIKSNEGNVESYSIGKGGRITKNFSGKR